MSIASVPERWSRALLAAGALALAALAVPAAGAEESVDALQKKCDASDADGCQNLALVYRKGDGVPKDLARAAALYQKACDLKDGDSCWMLSRAYADGEGVAKDEAKAEVLRKHGCKLGSNACQFVAYGVAVEPYIDDCGEGDAEACYWIGGAYQFGWDDLEVDPLLASFSYEKACDGNHAKACFMLALLYNEGTGVDKDPAIANDLFHKSRALADKTCAGYAKTAVTDCRTLGVIYNFGLGVAADPARARMLYDKSCRLGDKEACDLKVADAAAPQPKPAVAAARPSAAAPATSAAATPASKACKIVKVQLGVDTVASVERDIAARGGNMSSGTGLGKHRLSALSGDYRDAGTEVMAVNYDFDANAPTGRLIAVTIVNHANTGPGYEKLLAARKAAAATITGPLQQKSATEFTASAPNCKLRFLPNADSWFIYEVYELPKSPQ